MNTDKNMTEKASELYESQKGNIQNAKDQMMSGGNKSGSNSGGLNTDEMKDKAKDAMNKMKGNDSTTNKMKDSFSTN
ncbi:unnamed protein product [Ambrosiozyma monospora]|uniref:Unnamed protein product n=1 Tax=Ambrosiozyma monospora TaxID=43982 RepID=A0ACB5SS02_AMBMO|nr:unnamed protein product [Ambrosiozyma monospora]